MRGSGWHGEVAALALANRQRRVLYSIPPGDVAQLGEHCLRKAGVVGSSPIISTSDN